MKLLPKIILVAYFCALLWLLLFKTSLDFVSILADHQMRSLNLTPFISSRKSEMFENFVVFVPLGLLLSVNFKKIRFWQKLIAVFGFSLSIEAIQYILAIGVSDLTDLITNTLGGLFGLALYSAIKKGDANSEKRDRIIAVIVAILLLFSLFLRFFVFRVKY